MKNNYKNTIFYLFYNKYKLLYIRYFALNSIFQTFKKAAIFS